METMNIALPPEMKEFVRAGVSDGGYSSVSEYIRDLIRREQRRQAEARLETLLLEGIESGPARELSNADWEKLQSRARSTWEARRLKKKSA